jgi:hypothetical protein
MPYFLQIEISRLYKTHEVVSERRIENPNHTTLHNHETHLGNGGTANFASHLPEEV